MTFVMMERCRLNAITVTATIVCILFILYYLHCTQEQIDPHLMLSDDIVRGVKRFVFFIGYPRSGHSIIGSLMDAHVNMVIAHEYSVFYHLLWGGQEVKDKGYIFSALYQDSYNEARRGWRSSNWNRKGYNFEIEGMWQGGFENLLVIGDKSGGKTTKTYMDSPSLFRKKYWELIQTVGIPVHVIHVVRNPFDMIATSVLYEGGSLLHDRKVEASEEHKYNNSKVMKEMIKTLFARADAIVDMKRRCQMNILEIHHSDFVRDPKGTMKQICDFLHLECTKEYLQSCHDKTYKTLSKSRNTVGWPSELRIKVEKMMENYPFFQRYSFDSD